MSNDPRRGLPSASSLERLHNCPGSWLATKDMPDESSADADSGTRIHKALETGDMTGLSADEEQTADLCQIQSDNVMNEWVESDHAKSLGIHKEKRLGLTRIGGVVEVTHDYDPRVVFTGAADLIVIDGNRGLVLDYKTGRGEVADAAENLQLRGLAVMAARRWLLQSVRVAIVQPWAGPASVADYDRQAIDQSRFWLLDVLERVKAATPNDLNPGAWCHYCKAKAVCPALRSVALEPVEHMALTLPADDATARAALFARAMEMPYQRLVGLYERLNLVRWYQAAIEGAMRKRVEDGEIPGFRMAEGVETREITDASAAWALAESKGVKLEDFMADCVKVTLGDLEEKIRRASGPKITAKGTAHKTQFALSIDETKAVVDSLKGTGAMKMKKTAQTIEEVKA